MRKDFIIGLAVSALLIGSLFASSFFDKPEAVPVEPKAKQPTIKPMEVTIEPEDPVRTESDEVVKQKSPVAPPRAPDVPQLPDIDAPVQPLQPNVPADLNAIPDLNVIPTTSTPGIPNDIPIIDSSLLEQKPAPRAQMPPQYPFEMKNAGIEGEVAVEFIVDVNGDVRSPFVIRSTHREFEAAALQAISKWKFRPGRKDGRVVNAGRVQQLFTFRIND